MSLSLFRIIACIFIPIAVASAMVVALCFTTWHPAAIFWTPVIAAAFACYQAHTCFHPRRCAQDLDPKSARNTLLKFGGLHLAIPSAIVFGSFLSYRYDLFPVGYTSAALAPIPLVALLRIFGLPSLPSPPPLVPEYLSGTYVHNPQQAQARQLSVLAPNEHSLPWGCVRVPVRSASTHFCVIGTTGSGKSLTLHLIMRQVLPWVHPGTNHRALIFDASNDMPALLASMAVPEDRIRILHPFDRRSYAWDIAADVQDPIAAEAVSAVLVPEDPNERQPYFRDAARGVLYAVMLAFVNSKRDWRFSDLIYAMSRIDCMNAVIDTDKECQNIRDGVLRKTRASEDVLSTIATILRRYRPIAAAWYHATEENRLFTIQDWVDHEYILILGNDPKASPSLITINQTLFDRITHYLLSHRPSPGFTWVFIDEAARAGKLRSLFHLIQGRKFGICCFIAFQHIDGMWKAYDREEAEEIIAECNHKAFLKNTGKNTPQWISDAIGPVEEYVPGEGTSESTGSSGGQYSSSTTYSVNWSRQIRPAVKPSDITTLPPCNMQNGLHGYYQTPDYGTYYSNVPPAQIFPDSPPVPSDFQPRPREQLALPSWNEHDLTRLALPRTLLDSKDDTDDQDFRRVEL